MAREWTDEQRKAFAEKMKAARAKSQTKTSPKETKQVDKDAVRRDEPIVDNRPAPSQDDLLLKLVELLDRRQAQHEDPRTTSQLTPNANKIIDRYPIDKDFYQDPIPELLDYADASMPAMAIRTLYDLVWELTDRPYESKQGVWYNEPWHVIHVYKRMFDDQGDPVVQRDDNGNEDEVVIDWRTGYFFEDDVIVQQYINQNHLENYDVTEIANKLRMTRMKRWLRDVFYPPKPSTQFQAKDIIVNGQVVKQTVRSNILASLPSRQQIKL